MILDLYPEDNASLNAPTGKPSAGPEPTFSESFSTIMRSMTNGTNAASEMRNVHSVYQRLADDFHKVSGQRIPNPVQPFTRLQVDESKVRDYRGRGGNFRKMVDEWNQQNPDKLFILPPDSDVVLEAEKVGKSNVAAARDLDRRPSTLTSSAGGVVGMLAGGALDPYNVASMPFGGSGGLLRIFLKEAAIGAGASAASEASNYDYRTRIDPEYSTADMVAGIALGGLGQGVIATGIAGGVRGLAKLFNRNRTAADPVTRDAGNVTMAEATTDARVPQTATDLHANVIAAANKAIDDVYAGKAPTEAPDLVEVASARSGVVYDNMNTPHQVRYEVIDADRLVTSHMDDFRENPAFPQQYQPRDRTRAYSETQVNDIASNLVPERLGQSMDASTGAPIIGPDNLVESGNGRVLGIRRAYQGGMVSADRYAAWLKRMGFDIDGMDRPVLVARRISPLDDIGRQNFVRSAQDSGTMKLSASELAKSDAGKLDSDLLAIFAPGRVGSAKNRDFVREFSKKLSKGEAASLYAKKGELSVEGIKRIEAAMAARAYDDAVFLARVLEDADNNIKAIGGAMMDAAGPWAQMRADIFAGKVPAHLDLTNDLMDALRMVMRARDEGETIAKMVAQGDLLFEASPWMITLLRSMFNNGDFTKPVARSKLAEILKDFATEARKATDSPMLLGEPLTKAEILSGVLERAQRADLAAVAARLDDPAEVRERMMTPEGQDATVQEAYRQSVPTEGRADIMIADDAGNMRPASEVLMELDDMAAAAKELHACAVGKEAAE